MSTANHTCRVCKEISSGGSSISVPEMMYGSGEKFEYFECGRCGTLQIASIPDDLDRYYGKDYYSYNNEIALNDRLPDDKDDRAVLDVGCGSGKLLIQLYNSGMTNLTGCDPFIPNDIDYDGKIKIHKKTIHEMDGKYDLIYMIDSFEHVTDPHEVMESLNRLLSDDGTITVTVPVYPNVAYDEFGVFWYQLDAPRHLHLFSESAIAYLAQQHGLEAVGVEYDSNYGQFTHSFLYEKGYSFYEQTQQVYDNYFTEEDLTTMERISKVANEKRRGDHAKFFIKHA